MSLKKISKEQPTDFKFNNKNEEEAKKIIGLARDYGANDEEIKTLEIELHQ